MGDKDRRVEFIQEYTLKSMRLKSDKWNKIIIFDEQRQYLQVSLKKVMHDVDLLQAFLDSNEPQSMVISPNIAGHLHIHTDWPSALRNKGVYFVKKEKTPIPDDEVISILANIMIVSEQTILSPQNFDLCEFLAFGDIYPNALDHFCGWVEEVTMVTMMEEVSMIR